MHIRLLTEKADLARYDAWVQAHPQGNLWQSVERIRYIEARGKKTRMYASISSLAPIGGEGQGEGEIVASALVVIDASKGGFATWEIPRGPLWTDEKHGAELLSFILAEAKKANALTLYFSPTSALHIPQSQVLRPRSSNRLVHAEATRILDLTQSKEEILAAMHQKGRYNIKVAERNGVRCMPFDCAQGDTHTIEQYVALARQTAARDGFRGPSEGQYEVFLRELPGAFLMMAYRAASPACRQAGCELRAASDDNMLSVSSKLKAESLIPIAGLIGVIWNGTGYYYYGASDYSHRALMAPYLLQWEAMKYCKAQGCTTYDLLGIAPILQDRGIWTEEFEQISEKVPSPKSQVPSPHRWAGISDFKAKFGGTVVQYPPEQEVVLRPIVKGLLQVKRKIFG